MSYDRDFYGNGLPLNTYLVSQLPNQWNNLPCNEDQNNIGGKRCVNDKDYFIPYVQGDILDFQFQNPNFCSFGNVQDGADGSCDIDYISGGAGFEINIRKCCDNTILASYDLNSPNIEYTFNGYKWKDYPFSGEEIYCYQNLRIRDIDVCGCCPYVYTLATKDTPATGFYVFVNGTYIGDTVNGSIIAGYAINYYVTGTNKNPVHIVEITTPDCTSVSDIYIEDIDTALISRLILSVERDCEAGVGITVTGQCFYLEFVVNDIVIGYSQQYKCLDCGENSLFMEGEYSKFDCEDTFYGLPNSEEVCTNQANVFVKHKNTARVIGNLQRIGDKVERTITDSGCVSVSSKKTKQFKLTTNLLPFWMMDKLSTILAAKKITLGRNSFQFGEYILREDPVFKPSGIKGNTMFALEATFELCECQTEFNC